MDAAPTLFFSDTFDGLKNNQTQQTDIRTLSEKIRRAIIITEPSNNRPELLKTLIDNSKGVFSLRLNTLGPSDSIKKELDEEKDFFSQPYNGRIFVIEGLDLIKDQKKLYELVEILHILREHSIFIPCSEIVLSQVPELSRLPGFAYIYNKKQENPPQQEAPRKQPQKKAAPSKKEETKTAQSADNKTQLNVQIAPKLQEQIVGYKGKFYAVGADWGGTNQIKRFWENDLWESGDEKFEATINRVQVNDILILKSVHPNGGPQFRVKGLGKVLENTKNGTALQVKWLIRIKDYDIAGRLSSLRSRIEEMETGHFNEMIEKLPISDQQRILESTLFEPINEAPDTIIDEFPTTYRTRICNDFEGEDTLGFDSDVKSLASLVALKEMDPPLAIALFGQWGSGKSFFMKLLEKRIRELSDYQGFLEKNQNYETTAPHPDKPLFNQGIAHIRFNAWSYMDANLWAGLSHSLFEKLNEYITQNTKGTIEKLNVQVKIAKRLEILYSDLEQFNEKRNQLLQLKERIEAERERKILRYFKAENYDQVVTKFLADNGLNEKEIQSMTPSAIQKQIHSGINFLTYLKSRGFQVGILMLSATLILWLGIAFVDVYFKELQTVWMNLVAFIAPIFTTLAVFFRSMRKAKKKVKEYIDLIEKPRTDQELDDETKKLHKELEEIDEIRKEIKTSIASEHLKTTNITQSAIANFISVKPNQEDYRKHLGIITTIRKDFETLSELFAEVKESPQPVKQAPKEEEELRNTDAKEKTIQEKEFERLQSDKQSIRNSFSDNQHLERIVLYIDDLDRCPDEKIMEVLEAIHLLMAFPLFIVVVGVDERSVYNALMNRRLERYRGIPKRIVDDHIEPIEPHEYLEKIFQIPFQVPEANNKSISNFIDALLPNTIEPESDSVKKTPYQAVESENKTMVFYDSALASEPAASPMESVSEATQPDSIQPDLIPIAPADITISATEKQLLKDCSGLIGKNPRAIKRFVNIFRITKVYSHLRQEESTKSHEIIFLTALTSGEFDHIANKWIQAGTKPLKDFRNTDQSFDNALKELEKNKESGKEYQQLINKSASSFENDLRFIQRFSYNMQKLAIRQKHDSLNSILQNGATVVSFPGNS